MVYRTPWREEAIDDEGEVEAFTSEALAERHRQLRVVHALMALLGVAAVATVGWAFYQINEPVTRMHPTHAPNEKRCGPLGQCGPAESCYHEYDYYETSPAYAVRVDPGYCAPQCTYLEHSCPTGLVCAARADGLCKVAPCTTLAIGATVNVCVRRRYAY